MVLYAAGRHLVWYLILPSCLAVLCCPREMVLGWKDCIGRGMPVENNLRYVQRCVVEIHSPAQVLHCLSLVDWLLQLAI